MADLDLHIRRLSDDSLHADLFIDLPSGRANLGSAPIRINTETLLSLSDDPEVYGATLSAMIFPKLLREGWQRARGHAEGTGQGLHVRVVISDPSGALHALCWELLRDPLTNTPLAQQEGGSLARQVLLDKADDLSTLSLPTKSALCALVAVAGPVDAKHWGLAPVDVAGEAQRALAALGEIKTDVLAGDAPNSRGLATLEHIRDGLRTGAHILYLICHGKTTAQGTTLYLVGPDGNAAPITGDALETTIKSLAPTHRPLLAVLVACESASQESAPLAAVGPILARAGVPAVLAMQAPISMAAAANLTTRLLRELARDGRIDRALAAARKEMGDAWWVPVLWLRSSRLWADPDSPAAPPASGIHIGGNVGTMQVITVSGGQVGNIIGSQTNMGVHPPAPPTSTTSGQSDAIATQCQRLAQHRETLATLLNQQAIFGSAYTPPAVMHGIREAREGIARAKAALTQLGHSADDWPDDAR